MEFLEGQPLTTILRQRGRLELGAALALLRPLAEALDYAHAQGVVHRDVKPANVMVGIDGRVVLTDFGIARAGEGTGVTRSGMLLGTPAYMSPEQALGEPVDARSDQYALGVLAYEMLCGRAPFTGESTPVLLRQVAYEPPPPARQFCPTVPDGTTRALERVLAKSPAERFSSCAAFVGELEAPTARPRARPSAPAPAQTQPARKQRHAQTWSGILLAALVCVALLFGAVGGWRWLVGTIAGPPPPTPVPTRAPAPTVTPVPTASPYPSPGEAIGPENAARLEVLARLEGLGVVRGVAYSGDGALLAVAAPLGVYLYDVRTLDQVGLLGKDSLVESIAFSRDGQTLAAGWEDGVVLLWSRADGRTWETLETHRDDVLSVALSPDGRIVASGSEDTTVRLSRVSDGTRLNLLEGHTADVQSVAFSPDGSTLASAGDDGTIRLWAVPTGASLHHLEGHSGRIWCLAFSPDGSLLASGSDDRSVRLWQTSDWTLVRELHGHTLDVLSVAFAPDGQTLASSAWDGTVRLWRVTDGALLSSPEGQKGRVTSVAFSPDGKMLATGCADGSVWLWGVPE
jgi:WD40 repeat protein